MKNLCKLRSRNLIDLFIKYFADQKIQFSCNLEIEGVYERQDYNISEEIFYQQLNNKLQDFNIDAKIKKEFWQQQWEYETNFGIGNLNKIIADYDNFINNLDVIFAPHKVNLKPVIYNWQENKAGKKIHVPNAIQLNISLWQDGFNLFAQKNYALNVQNIMLANAVHNLIFFIPNQESLDRLLLKDTYNLYNELMSPHDISGGSNGSIAYYAEHNKKNEQNKLNIDFSKIQYQIKTHQDNWHKFARIEFRLASASLQYNLHLHVLFMLINLYLAHQIYSTKKQNILPQNQKSYLLPKYFSHEIEDNIIARFLNSGFTINKDFLFAESKHSQEINILLKQFLENLKAQYINY